MLPTYYASGKSKVVSKFPFQEIRQVEGTVVDSIVLAEPIQPEEIPHMPSIAIEVKRIVLRSLPTSLEMEDFDLHSVYKTLYADLLSERYVLSGPSQNRRGLFSHKR
jgi:hypothetical protein